MNAIIFPGVVTLKSVYESYQFFAKNKEVFRASIFKACGGEDGLSEKEKRKVANTTARIFRMVGWQLFEPHVNAFGKPLTDICGDFEKLQKAKRHKPAQLTAGVGASWGAYAASAPEPAAPATCGPAASEPAASAPASAPESAAGADGETAAPEHPPAPAPAPAPAAAADALSGLAAEDLAPAPAPLPALLPPPAPAPAPVPGHTGFLAAPEEAIAAAGDGGAEAPKDPSEEEEAEASAGAGAAGAGAGAAGARKRPRASPKAARTVPAAVAAPPQDYAECEMRAIAAFPRDYLHFRQQALLGLPLETAVAPVNYNKDDKRHKDFVDLAASFIAFFFNVPEYDPWSGC